jgi:hypothetical protein
MKYIKVGAAGFEADMPQLMPCEVPRQISWMDFAEDSECRSNNYGIQIEDKVICACCGGIFYIEELNELARETLCTNWVCVADQWIDCSDEISYNW